MYTRAQCLFSSSSSSSSQSDGSFGICISIKDRTGQKNECLLANEDDGEEGGEEE